MAEVGLLPFARQPRTVPSPPSTLRECSV